MLKKYLTALIAISALSMAVPSQANWFWPEKSTALPSITLQSGVMMPSAKPIALFKTQPQFHFSDQNNQAFGVENFKKQWTLVFFGFSYCPMLCPTTLAQLNNAYQQLTMDHFTPLPQIIFVTIDPARDSTANVKKFVRAFNPNFIGLRTDDVTSLGAFAHELDAAYEKVPGSGKDKDKKGLYTYTHTGDIAVLNPEGELVAMLTMPHTDKDIAHDYQAIVNQLK